jgi:dTDP-4-amino-4,6-dideoxy-D-galactose acyltransferase
MPPRCEFLTWDTDFFGVRIARIHGPMAEEDVPAVFDWCKKERVRCAYLLAGSDDDATVHAAEKNGFHLTDVRVTLECPTPREIKMPPEIRAVKQADVEEISQLASRSHSDSRFYYDPHFSRERCDALYATWAQKSCHGYADAVFVAERQGRLAGYITCHNDKISGRIGLIGVAEWARGAGLGRNLIHASFHYFAQSQLNLVTVVTQGRNIGAQRLYQRSGFATRMLDLWYHRWF